ncbi:MAG: amidohydrolase [Thermomicrobiales bacterium]
MGLANEVKPAFDADAIHARILEAIDREQETILAVADEIHANPELGMEEFKAQKLLTETIARYGFEVERGTGGIGTAFKAIRGGKGSGPAIAFLAEYDALPGLGHGCGHNLIAGSNLAAVIGLGAVIAELGGEVMLIGTPAEENKGGKVIMIENGAFDDVDVAFSSHHAGNVSGVPTEAPAGTCLAVSPRIFKYYGRTAHAALDPHNGINALNAVIHLFTGLDALRQHLTPDVRIHGIITHGGDAPNVVPEYAEAYFMFRGASRATVDAVVEQAVRVAEGAALMTGARLEIDDTEPDYDDVVPNYTLGRLLQRHFAAAGLEENPPAEEKPRATGPAAYSTDLGNVSRKMPTAAIDFAISEVPIPGHSMAVVEGSISEMGRANAIATGKALALAAADLLMNPELLAEAQAEFEAATAQ